MVSSIWLLFFCSAYCLGAVLGEQPDWGNLRDSFQSDPKSERGVSETQQAGRDQDCPDGLDQPQVRQKQHCHCNPRLSRVTGIYHICYQYRCYHSHQYSRKESTKQYILYNGGTMDWLKCTWVWLNICSDKHSYSMSHCFGLVWICTQRLFECCGEKDLPSSQLLSRYTNWQIWMRDNN